MRDEVNLDHLLDLRSKATRGPWSEKASRDLSGDVGISAPNVAGVIAECFADMRHRGEHNTAEAKANAAAIVALFNAFPSLAATIRASEARIKELEAERDQAVEDRKAFRDDWRAAEHACVEARHNLTAALAEVERLKGEADRYAKLRSIGAAPNGTTHLENGLGLVAQLLDEWIDKHWENRTAPSVRPSAPAPDRGVPGQRVTGQDWAELLAKAEKDQHIPDRHIMVDLILDLRDARATAAKIVEEWTNEEADWRFKTVAEAIRSLPLPGPSASPWRDIAESYKACLEAIVNADNATDLSMIKRRARCSLETAGTPATEAETSR